MKLLIFLVSYYLVFLVFNNKSNNTLLAYPDVKFNTFIFTVLNTLIIIIHWF